MTISFSAGSRIPIAMIIDRAKRNQFTNGAWFDDRSDFIFHMLQWFGNTKKNVTVVRIIP